VVGDAVFKTQKAPQKIELGLAVFLDLDLTSGVAQHPARQHSSRPGSG
jgi:hypothetical protein